jgi:phosphoglycerate kinase
MLYTLKDLPEDLKDKKIFVRLDLNVPLKNGKILDNTRIREALPTLNYLLEKGARLVVGSHLGRPKGDGPEDRAKFSMEPVALELGNLLNKEVVLIEDPASEVPRGLLAESRFDKIILLENLRFAPGEEKNDVRLCNDWARYVDMYVNDAFGSCHRAHASIEGLPKIMKFKAAGFLIEKEVVALTKVRDNPEEPFVLILGGSKVSDKIAVIENYLDKASHIIVGGAMAYTFLKAKGVNVGKSLVEESKVSMAADFMKRFSARDKEFILPVDHVVVRSLNKPEESQTTSDENIGAEFLGVDIGPKTQKLFARYIGDAKTVFWNGPMGIYETPPFNQGSFAIAKAMAESSAMTVIGGGDSAAAAVDSGHAKDIDHISTGGGASLEFMEGKTLPGLAILRKK